MPVDHHGDRRREGGQPAYDRADVHHALPCGVAERCEEQAPRPVPHHGRQQVVDRVSLDLQCARGRQRGELVDRVVVQCRRRQHDVPWPQPFTQQNRLHERVRGMAGRGRADRVGARQAEQLGGLPFHLAHRGVAVPGVGRDQVVLRGQVEELHGMRLVARRRAPLERVPHVGIGGQGEAQDQLAAGQQLRPVVRAVGEEQHPLLGDAGPRVLDGVGQPRDHRLVDRQPAAFAVPGVLAHRAAGGAQPGVA
jgi:hypothetical protein